MNILFVNEICGYFGGVEQNIADTAEGLRKRGHTCYLGYGETSERGFESYRALFQETFPCREAGAGENGAQPLDHILGRVSPDIIYLHKVSGTGPYLHLLSRTRIVRMVHDHDLCCPRRHKYFMINGRICHHKLDLRCWLDGAFLGRSHTSPIGFTFVNIGHKRREMRRNYGLNALLVGSRFMREELLQNGFPPEKVHIVPPVVRMENPAPSPLPEDPRILYVGQLIRGKGVDLLLQALPRLTCDYTARIVGTGNAEPKLKALSKELGIERNVDFCGWVPNDALGSFYSSARVVVVPSRWPEPFGMIGLEAMHHGRPVVAFNVGGIPDWLEHRVTGLLVPEQDVGALAASIEEVLSDPGLGPNLGKKGLERVHTRYAFERYLDHLEGYLKGETS
ncbi:MAG: glycosyltransferase family 4 protein [Deltaproteobacteria bacterium]|nr:glycosyltransferase family 4 protein [Deltaproteobacteria bacterium]